MGEVPTEDETIEQEVMPPKTKSCEELLQEYRKRCETLGTPKGFLINFDVDGDTQKITPPFTSDGTDDTTIAAQTTYNPAPANVGGNTHLWGRQETSERDSKIVLFQETEADGRWQIDREVPIFPGQDPFDCGIIQGEHVFGNVVVWPDIDNPKEIHYKTVFRRYKESFAEIVDENGEMAEPFASGPEKMKDIRLVDRQNGKIGVFTRPQKANFGGLGKIGYFEINSLDELETALAKYDTDTEEGQSTLIQGICNDDEWVGANQVTLLDDGNIGVLGHIARFRLSDPENPDSSKIKDYYGISFIFDPNTRQASDVKIIITAENFPPVKPNKEDLGSVYFTGGFDKQQKILYGSVGDVFGCGVSIECPF